MFRIYLLWASIGFFLLQAPAASSRTVLQVPTEKYPTISSALSATEDGDLVLVGPGVYHEDLILYPRSITLKSTHGARNTIICGKGRESVIRFLGVGDKHLTLTGFTITNGLSKLDKMSRKMGGGLNLALGHVCIEENIIFGNAGFAGAGIHTTSSGVIRNNLIAFNHASMMAGAVNLDKSKIDFYNNYVIANYAGNNSGAVSVHAPETPNDIRNNVFVENWSFFGGTMMIVKSSPLIENNLFYRNRGCRAGTVFCQNEGAESLIRGNMIQDNYACFGGGLCCMLGAAPRIVGNHICGNSTLNPYCIHAPEADPTQDSLETKADIDFSGGGVFCWLGSDAILVNNVITQNTARFHGGGVGCLSSSPVLVNNTVYDNKSKWAPCGLYCAKKSKPKAYNSLFWGNNPEEVSDKAEVSHCVVQGGSEGAGAMDGDLLLADPANLDLHLLPASPLIDAGTCEHPHMPELDFDQEARLSGASIDIGADEFIFPLARSQDLYERFFRRCDLNVGDLKKADLGSGIVVLNTRYGREPSLGALLEKIVRCVNDFDQVLPRWYKTQVRDPREKIPADYQLEYLTITNGADATGFPLPRTGPAHRPSLFTASALCWHEDDAPQHEKDALQDSDDALQDDDGASQGAEDAPSLFVDPNLLGLALTWIPLGVDADGAIAAGSAHRIALSF